MEICKAFWSKVLIRGVDQCWEWNAGYSKNGRGVFWVAGKQAIAPRISFLLSFGFLDTELQVLHSCDNGKCVNPMHLFQGTQLLNMHDMIRKGRKQMGEIHHRAILKEKDVIAIREEYKSKRTPHHRIAQRYGMNKTTIGNIIRGRIWKHLLPPDVKFRGLLTPPNHQLKAVTEGLV